MTPAELGVLAGMALADSTSIGTLVVPVWLLLRRDFQARRTLLYLVILGCFYWVVSLLMLLSLSHVVDIVQVLHLGAPWVWGQLILGLVVLAIGFRIDHRPAPHTERPPRIQRWRDRTQRFDGCKATVALALTAGLTELLTMLPLLTAVGMLNRSNLSPLASSLVISAYVVLMMLPASVLLVVRTFFGARMANFFTSFGGWLERRAHVLVATILMAVGGLIAADAAVRLGLFT